MMNYSAFKSCIFSGLMLVMSTGTITFAACEEVDRPACAALCRALKANDIDCVDYELPVGRAPTIMNKACSGCGYPPLFVATSSSATQMVINAGADVRKRVWVVPDTPLDMLVNKYTYRRCTRSYGLDSDKCSVLRHAVWSGNCDKVGFLLSRYPDIHVRPYPDIHADIDGDRDLMFCALVSYYYTNDEEGLRLIDLLFKYAVGVPYSHQGRAYKDRDYMISFNALCYVCCSLLWRSCSDDDSSRERIKKLVVLILKHRLVDLSHQKSCCCSRYKDYMNGMKLNEECLVDSPLFDLAWYGKSYCAPIIEILLPYCQTLKIFPGLWLLIAAERNAPLLVDALLRRKNYGIEWLNAALHAVVSAKMPEIRVLVETFRTFYDPVTLWQARSVRCVKSLIAAGADPLIASPRCEMASCDDSVRFVRIRGADEQIDEGIVTSTREIENEGLTVLEKFSMNFCECGLCLDMVFRRCCPCTVVLVIADESVQQKVREREAFLRAVLDDLPTDLQKLTITYLPLPHFDRWAMYVSAFLKKRSMGTYAEEA